MQLLNASVKVHFTLLHGKRKSIFLRKSTFYTNYMASVKVFFYSTYYT